MLYIKSFPFYPLIHKMWGRRGKNGMKVFNRNSALTYYFAGEMGEE